MNLKTNGAGDSYREKTIEKTILRIPGACTFSHSLGHFRTHALQKKLENWSYCPDAKNQPNAQARQLSARRRHDGPCIRLGRADHRQSARHDLRDCRHTAGDAWHGRLSHCSRQLIALPPPWAAIAGNEDCITTRRASAASVYVAMRHAPIRNVLGP
jgi:hypothetical protein